MTFSPGARGEEAGADRSVPEVLFVCVHNAGRSQMAAGLLNRLAGGRVHVRSAGSTPAAEINPAVVRAMAEVGLDLSKEIPKAISDDTVRAADVVITMGCGDACPVYPGKRYLDWDLPDPAGKPLEEVRPIRDEIDRRVRDLLWDLVQGEPPAATSEQLFEQLATRYRAEPMVSEGTGFGSNPGLRVGGRIFAMLNKGELVVKLPKERVDHLFASGAGVRFDPGRGRLMNEWIAIPVRRDGEWERMVGEAFLFVGSAARSGHSR